MKIRIYTDGACSGNPGAGGWGAVILLPNEKQQMFGCEKHTTNNRMELIAVIESLKEVIQTYSNNKIDVYSDSAYVVNAVKNGWLHKWKWNNWRTVQSTEVKNRDLWEELEKLLFKHKGINFVKVKGHDGDKYNEICDKIAREQVIIAKDLL